MPPARKQSLASTLALASVATGAFLLFLVQPLAARRLLPTMGGSAGVWTACMFFFQTLLLAGYVYAHLLGRLRPRVAAGIHTAVLFLAAMRMPLVFDVATLHTGAPLGSVLLTLARSVGVPYFALAASTPLLEALVRETHGYRRFAVSNAGSLLALLAYPMVVEPSLALPAQELAFTAGFFVYIVLMASTITLAARTPAALGELNAAAPVDTVPTSRVDFALWIVLAALPSLLLLTTTSELSACIAPIPLLWIVPLFAYLASFIVAFSSVRIYRRAWMLPLAAFAIAIVGIDMSLIEMAPLPKIALVAGAFFVASTAAHGELVRLRPAGGLTAFYVSLSFGGALGSSIAALVAPAVFRTTLERPLGAALLCVALVICVVRSTPTSPVRRTPTALAMGLAAVFVLSLGSSGKSVAAARNFYGSIRIVDVSEKYGRERRMVHGGIIHGVESLDPARAGEPMSYFTRQSGLARAVAFAQRRGPIRFGVVGLGIGSSLEYLQPADRARVYELDPLVVRMARDHFTIVARHEQQTQIVVGDGRALLAEEPASTTDSGHEDRAFDVLALDAFSGDAVPVHLLTLEAFRMYSARISPTGFLCVHVTNLYVDLEPVVREAASAIGFTARNVIAPGSDRGGKRSHWVILHRDPAVFDDAAFAGATPLATEPRLIAWTDDFSSVWRVVRGRPGL